MTTYFKSCKNHWFVGVYGGDVERPSRLAEAFLRAQSAPKGERYITGWKKALRVDNVYRCVVIELRIPITAAMRQPINKKCRASEAEVVAIYDIEGPAQLSRTKRRKARADYDRDFVYEVGKVVKTTSKFCTINRECESGIHFFLTKEEAADYIF